MLQNFIIRKYINVDFFHHPMLFSSIISLNLRLHACQLNFSLYSRKPPSCKACNDAVLRLRLMQAAKSAAVAVSGSL